MRDGNRHVWQIVLACKGGRLNYLTGLLEVLKKTPGRDNIPFPPEDDLLIRGGPSPRIEGPRAVPIDKPIRHRRDGGKHLTDKFYASR